MKATLCGFSRSLTSLLFQCFRLSEGCNLFMGCAVVNVCVDVFLNRRLVCFNVQVGVLCMVANKLRFICWSCWRTARVCPFQPNIHRFHWRLHISEGKRCVAEEQKQKEVIRLFHVFHYLGTFGSNSPSDLFREATHLWRYTMNDISVVSMDPNVHVSRLMFSNVTHLFHYECAYCPMFFCCYEKLANKHHQDLSFSCVSVALWFYSL